PRRHDHESCRTHTRPVTSSGPGQVTDLLNAYATGGGIDAFPTADRLAAFAGVAPAPRDSGQISGNLHRPKRYHRRLQRVFYQSAMVSIRCDPNSRRFYDRKRAEGKHHVQAVLALARRRVNVLWALIRDRRCYTVTPPVTHAA
ncbi:transposase, partial [Streptomyces mirabilis]|uniref:transposase n=1 Tax=Streptomyces mirabilis TaxID=68239 RepID=UPI0036CABDE7